MNPIRHTCQLREEVQHGDLQDALFAADFGHVIEGIAPSVYRDPQRFFQNTHPAAPLKKVVQTIFERLSQDQEAGGVIRLSTGFGGGKTHTLIALWHLAKNIHVSTLGTDLVPAAGRPHQIAVAGVDGEKAGSEVFARHPAEGIETHSLWGELALQLGGAASYANVQSIDDPEKAPDSALIRSLLPSGRPVLILLDELVKYMVKLSDRGSGALLAFIGALVSEVAARPQAMLVISDPAGQSAYSDETQKLIAVARRLDDELSRKVADYDPIGNEAAQVIIRRLFERVDTAAAASASAEYFNTYQRIYKEDPTLLPPEAATMDYAEQIRRCYPFHPRLLETAQNRLGALQSFHKSRGTLRLFGRLLRDIWDGGSDLPIITAGEVNWQNPSIQSDLLNRIQRDDFKAAVNADVIGHAGQLDGQFSTDIHRRVASALLLESLPLTANAGMDKRDLALSTLRPSDVGHEAGEAMDRLLSVCWHTYKADDSGTRFQFRFEPNVNKLIEERAQNVPYEDARQRVLAMVQGYFGGTTFKLVPFPESAQVVGPSSDLRLVVGADEKLVQSVCDYEDDSDPAAKVPRRFRNAIVGIAPTHKALEEATRVMRELMAADQIRKEHQRHAQVREQIDEQLPQIQKRARYAALRAFNRVILHGRPVVTLEEKYLAGDGSVMETAGGQANLKQFLDDHKLIFQPADAIDVDLLCDTILDGATPSIEHVGAYPASAVHERALASDRLRLMLNDSPVRNAILKAVKAGKLVVRLPSGEVFDALGCVSGAEGERRRVERPLVTLPLRHEVLLAPAGAACVAGWTATNDVAPDADSNDDSPLPPIPLPVVNAASWDEALDYAAVRPLRTMRLSARGVAAARQLLGAAQPLNAETLSLSVRVGGPLKDGGQINFVANGLKHNHALKPIETAAQMLRAMTDTAQFEAQLQLGFGEGVTDSAVRLEQAREASGEDISLMAEFGEESTTVEATTVSGPHD